MRGLRRRRERRLPAGLTWCEGSASVCDARSRARRLRDEQRARASQARLGGVGW